MTHDSTFKIVPLPSTVASLARESRRDEFGNLLSILRDGERHQCRSCLSLSQPDEGVILLSYQPFASQQPYAEIGPIFIHERDCQLYANLHTYPQDFPRNAVVLRAYNDADQIVAAEPVLERRVEDVIAEMLNDETIAYLHARNLGYGCYMFRVERR
jgi:hypothetical protein